MSGARAFLQEWEETTQLSAAQHDVIAAMAEAAAAPPLPKNLVSAGEIAAGDTVGEGTATGGKGADGEVFNVLGAHGAHVNTLEDFHGWFESVESVVAEEKEEKYGAYVRDLQQAKALCDGMLSEASAALKALQVLEQQHRLVSTKTSALHGACEELIRNKEALVRTADGMRAQLAYFDELDQIDREFNKPGMGIEDEQFLPLLVRLDECLRYLSEHEHFRDSPAYIARFQVLQAKGLSFIKTHVTAKLRHVAEKVQKQVATRRTRNEDVDNTTLSNRFRMLAAKLQPIIAEIEKRAGARESHEVLLDCQQTYYHSRVSLLTDHVHVGLAALAAKHDITGLIRAGCAFVVAVCKQEVTLYRLFFLDDAVVAGLHALLESLAAVLYHVLRPLVISLQGMEQLCEVCNILSDEILDALLVNTEDVAMAVEPVVLRVLHDVQERLVFRVQTFVHESIVGHQPSDADLDYPAKLEALVAHTGGRGGSGVSMYKAWYPTLNTTLSVLAQVNRCVDKSIFAGIAQEYVSECTRSLLHASKQITARAGALDGSLFLIQHLFILREQISPFGDFSTSSGRDLDFTHVKDRFLDVLRGGTSSLFTLTRNNPLLEFVVQAPRILESVVDSKRDLERELKAALEAFILSVTQQVTGPLVALMQRSDRDRLPLAERVGAVRCTRANMREHLVPVVRKMALYLAPETRGILFRPIKTNICASFDEWRADFEQHVDLHDRVGAEGDVPSHEDVARELEDMLANA